MLFISTTHVHNKYTHTHIHPPTPTHKRGRCTKHTAKRFYCINYTILYDKSTIHIVPYCCKKCGELTKPTPLSPPKTKITINQIVKELNIFYICMCECMREWPSKPSLNSSIIVQLQNNAYNSRDADDRIKNDLYEDARTPSNRFPAPQQID